MPGLHRDRCGAFCRLHGAGCSVQPRRGRGSGAARAGRLQAGAGTLQGLHDRRSAHADQHGVQRHAQDAGRAAGIPEIRIGHHRSAEGAGDGAEPLPAVQSASHGAGNGVPASTARAAGRADCGRSRCLASSRTCRARLDAGCLVADRPGHRLQRGPGWGGRPAAGIHPPDAGQRGQQLCVPPDRSLGATCSGTGAGGGAGPADARPVGRACAGRHDTHPATHGRLADGAAGWRRR